MNGSGQNGARAPGEADTAVPEPPRQSPYSVTALEPGAAGRGPLVAAHQVDHLPWLGYFERVLRVDVFVELDCVQYNHQRFQNRNRIVDAQGRVHWLRVPVRAGKRHTQRMIDVEIAREPWQRGYLQTIQYAYAHHPHCAAVLPRVAAIVEHPWRRLIDLNRALRSFFLDWLGLAIRVPLQSELGLGDEHGEALLIAIARAAGAGRFLSGPTGRSFLDATAFARAGVPLEFAPSFAARPYPQHGLAAFVPDLSALDLVMNLGLEAGPWLREAHGVH